MKSRFNFNIDTNWLFYFCLYAISFGFVLIHNGFYWDDWVTFNVSTDVIFEAYQMSGRPIAGFYYKILFYLDPHTVWLYNAVVFFSYLIPVFILDKILSNIKEIDQSTKFFLCSLFAVFPVNSSRITITMSQYGFFYLMFFIGLGLAFFFSKEKKISVVRILSLAFFYLSFTLDSLLMFYSVLPISLLFRDVNYKDFFSSKPEFSRLKVAKNFLVNNFDYFILPILYFLIKVVFFKPYGLYTGYNSVSLSNFVQAFKKISYYLASSILPIMREWSFVIEKLHVLVILLAVCMYFLVRRKINDIHFTKTKVFVFFLLGFLFTFVATFPYFVIGAYPEMNNWASRHQILMPLGGAFLVFSAIVLSIKCLKFLSVKLASGRMQRFVDSKMILTASLSLTLSVFILSNLYTQLQYQKDWFKQLSMIENVRKSEILKQHTSFRFVDNTTDLNATKRTYNFYELTGILKYVFNDETRYASFDQKFDYAIDSAIAFPRYNISSFVIKDYEYEVTIEHGETKIKDLEVIYLTALKYLNYDKFNERIKSIVSFSYKKIEP